MYFPLGAELNEGLPDRIKNMRPGVTMKVVSTVRRKRKATVVITPRT